jgi:hypothetical protein
MQWEPLKLSDFPLQTPMDDELRWAHKAPDDDAVEVARNALKRGANVAAISYMDRESHLAVALSRHKMGRAREELVKLLIDAGAKFASVAEEKLTFDSYIRGIDAAPCMLQYLFTNGVFESLEIEDIVDAAAGIILRGRYNSLYLLRVCIGRAIAIGADRHEFISNTVHGQTMLHSAVSGGLEGRWQVEMVQELIDRGADVLRKDDRGYTAEERAILISPQRPRHCIEVIAMLKTERLKQEKLALDKCVAFSMGHHERLGIEAMNNTFEPEIVRRICELTLGRISSS